MREMLFCQLNQLQTDLRIVNRIDQHLGFCRPRRLQHIHARGIAVKHFHIKFTQRIHVVRIVIEDHHLHPAGEQHTTGDLPVTAEAGDNHPRLLFINLIRFAFLAAG